MTPFETTRILPVDSDAGFSSGEPALDKFFATHAYANDERGLGATYVLRAAAGGPPPAVLGFYTLSMAVIESAQASLLMGKLPRYPIPAALIGRLAVDSRAQGRGVGQRLLVDALSRILGLSEDIGCSGVVVDAKNEAAERFYLKHSFATVDATAWPRRMFIAMATVRGSVA